MELELLMESFLLVVGTCHWLLESPMFSHFVIILRESVPQDGTLVV
jgi:hypothetical protein